MSNSPQIYVGIDDGYAETKIVLSNGDSFRIPSQAKAGEMNQISINGSDTTVFPYSTPDGNYIIGDIRESDSTAFDDYPLSALNRVIVSHAISQSTIDPASGLVICTGLPIKKFYISGRVNANFVKQKMLNLLKNDVVSLGGKKLPKIIKHEVISEGIAAWMDIVIQRNSSGKLIIEKSIAAERIAIIDIGGRTTDIAVIQNGNLDTSRSSTINVGMLAVMDSVAESITNRFEISPSVEQMNNVISKKTIRLWGQEECVADLVEIAQKSVLARIESEAKRCLGNAADLDRVFFVGGTVEEVKAHLGHWFRNQIIGTEPGYANARGMQKYAEFIMSKE